MAKEIIRAASNCETAEGIKHPAPAFRAQVFKQLPPSHDFGRSQTIALPGLHTCDAAWAAVFAALRSDANLIGGDVLPVAS